MRDPAPASGRETELVDPDNGATLRIVVYGGHVYFEAQRKHSGDTIVFTQVRVDSDIAMLALRKLVLT